MVLEIHIVFALEFRKEFREVGLVSLSSSVIHNPFFDVFIMLLPNGFIQIHKTQAMGVAGHGYDGHGRARHFRFYVFYSLEDII
jgi:hypothetical protein